MQFQSRPKNQLLKRKFSTITAKTGLDKCYSDVLFRVTMRLTMKLFEKFYFFFCLNSLRKETKWILNLFNCVKMKFKSNVRKLSTRKFIDFVLFDGKVVKIITEEGRELIYHYKIYNHVWSNIDFIFINCGIHNLWSCIMTNDYSEANIWA